MRHEKSNRSQPELLTTKTQVSAMTEKLERETIIAVDTEFIRESSFYPRVALIQVATEEEVWLLDPTVLNPEDLESFLNLLEAPNTLKVFHASHADQECFFWSYQRVAQPILDTSIAAALCGMGESIGLQKLTREMLGIHLPKGRARAKWLSRPLPSELLRYAEQDVLHLVRLAKELRRRLEKLNRWDWALEESRTDPSRFDISPTEIAQKLAKGSHMEREVGVLEELVSWRESRAREANLPRGWIADNEVLISLARTKPEKIEDLKTFRGIHAKEIERSGVDILSAISRGKAKVKTDFAAFEPVLQKLDTHAIDLIDVFVRFLAVKNKIMPRFLLNQSQLYQVLLHSKESVEQWVKRGVISERAAQLIGGDLKSFLMGDLTLQIKDQGFRCLSLSPTSSDK